MFAEGEQLLEKLSGIQVNAKQIERLTHTYGQVWQETQAQQDAVKPKEGQLHYAMMDGGMVLTRKEGWKEMKLGRVFAAVRFLAASAQRNFIHQSQYVAHLGDHHTFLEKLSPQVDHLTNLVWIADGARWIWDWIEQYYPDSVQILDYYHVKERLCDFALEAFRIKPCVKSGLGNRKNLLEDQAETVLASIALMSCSGKAKQLQKYLHLLSA